MYGVPCWTKTNRLQIGCKSVAKVLQMCCKSVANRLQRQVLIKLFNFYKNYIILTLITCVNNKNVLRSTLWVQKNRKRQKKPTWKRSLVGAWTWEPLFYGLLPWPLDHRSFIENSSSFAILVAAAEKMTLKFFLVPSLFFASIKLFCTGIDKEHFSAVLFLVNISIKELTQNTFIRELTRNTLKSFLPKKLFT